MKMVSIEVLVVLDFMCPWSFIGMQSLHLAKRQLMEEHPDVVINTQFLPYEFDPPGTYPDGGTDWSDYCRSYGRAKAKFLLDEKLPRAFALGKVLGINFRLERRIVHTERVNSALHVAARHAQGEAFALKILRAHFEGLQDPNGPELLRTALHGLGVPAVEVTALIEEPRPDQAARNAAWKEEAHRLGPSSSGGGTSPTFTAAIDHMWRFGVPRRQVATVAGKTRWELLKRGQPGGAMYSLWASLSDFNEFGLGIALYFYSLLFLAAMCLCSFLIMAPNIAYFSSNSYSSGQPGVNWRVRGSAVCTRQVCTLLNVTPGGPPYWPVAANASCAQNTTARFGLSAHRAWDAGAVAQALRRSGTLTLAATRPQQGACRLTWNTGIVDLVNFGFLIVCILAYGRFQERMVTSLDEQQQTAQDYSVVVHDPPADARDPDRWRDFFEAVVRGGAGAGAGAGAEAEAEAEAGAETGTRAGRVAMVTVALKNGEILHTASALMAAEKRLRDAQGGGGLPAPEGGVAARLLAQRLVPLRREQSRLAKAALALSRVRHDVAKVIVTFEREADQRACLERMCVGAFAAWADSTAVDEACRGVEDAAHGVAGAASSRVRGAGLADSAGAMAGAARVCDPPPTFRDARGREHVLAVHEAAEPSDVFWWNLHVPLPTRVVQQLLSLGGAALVVFGAFHAVRAAKRSGGSAAAAITVSACNLVLPTLLKWVTTLEQHHDFTSENRSMLRKLLLARFVTSAIVIYLITPFGETLGQDSLVQIQEILIADAFTTPIVRLLNLPAVLPILVLAPRARSQEQMNRYFEGSEWWLAERYTDMTKTFFVSMFYASLLPSGLLITAVSMLTTFAVDKVCLLRWWKLAPKVDAQIAQQNRGHLMFCVLVKLFMALRFYWSWPFDDFCATGGNATTGGLSPCDRRLPRTIAGWLLPGTRAFMNPAQSQIVSVYEVVLLTTGVIFFAFFFLGGAVRLLQRVLFGHYQRRGKASATEFSDLHPNFVDAYVPGISVHEDELREPLLACRLRGFDCRYVSWRPRAAWPADGSEPTNDNLRRAFRDLSVHDKLVELRAAADSGSRAPRPGEERGAERIEDDDSDLHLRHCLSSCTSYHGRGGGADASGAGNTSVVRSATNETAAV
eukprot:g5576.t1